MSILWCERRNFRYWFFCTGCFVWLLLFVALLNVTDLLLVGQMATVHLSIMATLLLVRSFCARNPLYLIFFSFIALYVLPAKLFFFDGLYFSAYHQTFSYYTAGYTTLIFSLFLLFVNLFLIIPQGTTKQIRFRKNNCIFWLLYIIAFIIVCMCRRKGNMYGGEDGGLSTLNEYVIILFLICFIYSSNEKLKNRALYFLYALYAFFAIITGGRIELVLLFFLLLATVLQYKFSFKFLFLCFLFGVWGMTLFGKIRHDPAILLQQDIISIIFDNRAVDLGMQTSNEGDVYWASERLLCLIEDGNLNFISRVEAAVCYFLSPLAPSSYFPETANLSAYRKDLMDTGGGNLAPVNFFVMFGFLGTVFLGYFVSRMLNMLSKDNCNLPKIYILLMVITVSRWFAYNPIQLVKLCVWGIVCYYLVISVDYTVKKYRQNNR